MLSANGIRNIVGIVGNVISFGLFLSPMPTFYKIWKKGDVEQFSPIPYIATILNCMLWIFYGIPIVHPNSLLVVTINGVGFFLELFYITLYLVYSTNKQRLRVLKYLAAEAAFMACVIGLTLGLAHTHTKRSLIVGSLCVIFGSCMYASPLIVMKMVIQTKSVKYMPFWLSLVGFLNGVCWTAYALIRFDLFVTIPNGLGAIFGAAQLILYGCFYSTTPKDENKLEVQLPTSASTIAPVTTSPDGAVDKVHTISVD